jgi:hypothetical protein
VPWCSFPLLFHGTNAISMVCVHCCLIPMILSFFDKMGTLVRGSFEHSKDRGGFFFWGGGGCFFVFGEWGKVLGLALVSIRQQIIV